MIASCKRFVLLAVLLLPSLLQAADEASIIEIEVRRAGFSEEKSSINWEVRPTGENPVDAKDFHVGALPSGTLEFDAGEKSGTIEIYVRQDTDVEPDETFKVILTSSETGSIISGERRVTLINDDEDTSTPLELSLSADKVSKVEVWKICVPESFESSADLICGSSENITDGGGQIQNDEVSLEEQGSGDSTRLYLTVNAARSTLEPYTVDFRVRGKGNRPADGADFGGALPAGTVTMASTSQSFTIDIQGDDKPEYSEGFLVELLNPTGGAILGNARVGGTIKGELTEIPSGASAESSGAEEAVPVQPQTASLTVQNRDIKLFRVIPLNGGTNPFDFVDVKNDIAEADSDSDETPDNPMEPEPPPDEPVTPDPGLTLTSSLPVTDDNGDDSQIILIEIDSSDNLSAVQSPSMTDSNTALRLIGNVDVSFPGTANVFETTAFMLISPGSGTRLDENVNNEIIVQRSSSGDFYKIILQFVQTGFDPGDVQVTDLSAFNCGNSQSDCP